jgi:sulfatase maturation enzyme AslB (radical SAM superfamily)
MEKILLEGSDYKPTIDFSLDGVLKLEGKAMPENAASLFNPLIEFVDQLNTESVKFDINLYYFNTASSKKLLQLLRHLDANTKINHIQVNWHFEEGDEDSVETAEIFEESLLRTNFSYLEYAEAC